MPQNINRLDLNLLRIFLAIYDARNISRAAKELNMTQPTMSNALGRLREALNDPLFIRAARGMNPTSRADDLADPIRKILREADNIILPTQGFDPAIDERKFRLCIIDSMEPVIMPHLIRESGGATGIQFEMLLAPATVIEDALNAGHADLVVNLPAELHPDLEWEALCPLDLVIVARKGHPEIQGTASFEQIKRTPHVSLAMRSDRMANTRLLRTTKAIGFRSAITVSRVGSLVDLVATTDLIAIVPRLQATTSAAADRLQVIDIPWQASTQTLNMTWHKRSSSDDADKWLRSKVRSAVEMHLQ